MGYYINEDSKGKHIGTSFLQKLNSLIDDGAVKIDPPTEFKEGLVCVVDNVILLLLHTLIQKQRWKNLNGQQDQNNGCLWQMPKN